MNIIRKEISNKASHRGGVFGLLINATARLLKGFRTTFLKHGAVKARSLVARRNGQNSIAVSFFCQAFLLLLLALAFAACDRTDSRQIPDKYTFEAYGVTISVGDGCDDIILRLGEPNKFSCASSCAGVGDDELYIYNGFKLTAHRADGKAEIISAELTNDTVSTAEGVSIGDSAQRVREIYGEGESFSGGVEYRAERGRLRFFIREGKVVGVRYS